MTTTKPVRKAKQIVKKHPTEVVAAGPALGIAIYGYATQVGLPHVVAAVLAVVAAFGPLVVTRVVVAIRSGN